MNQLNANDLVNAILKPEETAKQLAKLAADYRGDLGHLFPEPELLKRFYPYMSDKELKVFANGCYLVSQSVAEFLVPRIRRAQTFEERVAIGKFFGYWRIWRMIIRVPGLSMTDIRRIQQLSGNSDVTPWDD